jgi:hypothetical protein
MLTNAENTNYVQTALKRSVKQYPSTWHETILYKFRVQNKI